MLVKSNIHLINHLLGNGGFTVNTKTFTHVRQGYAVASECIGCIRVTDIRNRNIWMYKEVNTMLERKDLETLGAWINGAYCYFYKTHVVEDKKEAIELAKKHNQKAIYDLKNEMEVFI